MDIDNLAYRFEIETEVNGEKFRDTYHLKENGDFIVVLGENPLYKALSTPENPMDDNYLEGYCNLSEGIYEMCIGQLPSKKKKSFVEKLETGCQGIPEKNDAEYPITPRFIDNLMSLISRNETGDCYFNYSWSGKRLHELKDKLIGKDAESVHAVITLNVGCTRSTSKLDLKPPRFMYKISMK